MSELTRKRRPRISSCIWTHSSRDFLHVIGAFDIDEDGDEADEFLGTD